MSNRIYEIGLRAKKDIMKVIIEDIVNNQNEIRLIEIKPDDGQIIINIESENYGEIKVVSDVEAGYMSVIELVSFADNLFLDIENDNEEMDLSHSVEENIECRKVLQKIIRENGAELIKELESRIERSRAEIALSEKMILNTKTEV